MDTIDAALRAARARIDPVDAEVLLTHALGQPAVSEAAVVAAVVRARGARLARLGGRIWRNGRSFSLVVAQPYLDPG